MSLKLKSYLNNVAMIDFTLQKKIFHIMLYLLGILAFFYVFLLNNMVFNIIQRKSFESNARILSNEVGNLELSYLSISNKIDLSLSYNMGFKEIKKTFATRKTVGILKMRQNEI